MLWLPKLLYTLKGTKWSQMALKVLFYWCYIKHNFIYLLRHIIFLVIFGLFIIIKTIAGGGRQKVTMQYIKLLVLLCITLAVPQQLFLVSCSAKVIQTPYCNGSYKRVCDVPYKWFCYKFQGKLQLSFDYILRPFYIYCDLLRNSLQSADLFQLVVRFSN